jgi:acyl-coenzyme A thioesterase PaaI-like protein
VALRLAVGPAQVHAGGVLCGQALMAAADTALVLAASRVLGGFRPMTTVQMQASFLRPIPGDAGFVAVEAIILRRGRTLLFGEAKLSLPHGPVAVHVTGTTALV